MDLIVDDRNPGIAYSANQWERTGMANEYNLTTTCSNVVGATATISFFGSVSVSVSGTIDAAANGLPPQSSYSIGGGTPAIFTAVQQEAVQYWKVFFASGALVPTAHHTLVIEVLQDKALYCIDFISLTPIPIFPIVQPSVDEPTVLASPQFSSESFQNPSSSGTSSSTSIPSPTTSSSPNPGSMMPSLTSTSKVTSKSSTRLHTKFRTRSSATIASTSVSAEQTGSGSHERLSSGVAAGIAVGIIAAVVVVIAILCFVRRQRRRHSSHINHGSLWTSHLPPPSESTLSPFILRNEAPLNWSPKNEKDELRKQDEFFADFLTMIFDDRDPSIVYNANHWGVEENPGEFDGTSTFCNIVGGTATFDFNGPATISVFGVVQATSSNAAGRSTYSIDGGSPQTFNPPSPSTAQFNVKFFETSVTSSGSHTLVITTLDGDKHFVYIDFIEVVQQAPPTTTATHQDPPPPPQSPTTIVKVVTKTNAQGVVTTTTTTSIPAQTVGSNTQAAGPDTQSSARSGAIQTESSPSSPTLGGTAGSASSPLSGTSHGTGPSQAASASSQVVTVVNGVTFTTFLPPTTASFPSLDTTSSPQVAAAPAHHVSLGVIIGPVIGALVILALLLLAAICYARSWFKRVLKSKEEEAASEAPSSTAPPVSDAASTTPVSNDGLSRWIPGAASRRLMSVSPFMLGDDNAAAPPPYRPASGKLETPVKPGSSTSPLDPPLL
ncbi:hypothetical protein D9613_008864 [Agrocybe pediades]|uniref:Uncharacterized protein n=1 Tax=Agrocybe pediades TaxID=84607 RepID=A0A8H4QSB3_9AGAR|nr:hypothetical protein D9613_008864 [Agrocybe pediades]